eukprot:7306086-Karenia_brevis.AAC.1
MVGPGHAAAIDQLLHVTSSLNVVAGPVAQPVMVSQKMMAKLALLTSHPLDMRLPFDTQHRTEQRVFEELTN